MALYFYFNATTGDLVYSDKATYSGSGYTSLGQQTNTNPTTSDNWVFHSKRASIKTVTKDPNLSAQINVLTNMNSMFRNCTALTFADLSGFDTSNVENTGSMFYGCNVLTSINLGSFNTSNITNMETMFSDCRALTSLDVSGFNTSNTTNMNRMFEYCTALTSLDLSSFDTSNVTIMGQMFSDCSSLTSLDLSSFDTSMVENISGMFYGCTALTSLDLSNFDISNTANAGQMFFRCTALRIIDISPNMSRALWQLPAATYYDAVTRQSYAKADIPGGSTYVRDLADLDLVATMVQARMGINVAKHVAHKALKSINAASRSMDAARALSGDAGYDESTLELVTDATGKVTEVHFLGA